MNYSPKITIISTEVFKRTIKQKPIFTIYSLKRKWKQVIFTNNIIKIKETTKLSNKFKNLTKAFSKKKGDTLPS